MHEKSLVIFLSPKKIWAERFSSAEKPVKWVYLGKQFHEKDRIEKDLGSSFQCLDISRIHNDVADTIRMEFVEWVDTLNNLNGSSLEWWLGSVSSRNVYRSNVFQYCCYIEIFDTIWQDPETRPTFVVTESVALANTLKKWGTEHNIEVSIRGKWAAFTQPFGDYVLFFIRWINFIATSSLRKCGSLVLTGKPPVSAEKITHPVIIHSYIHPLSITEIGVFTDRYFPYLYHFLETHDRQILVLPTYHGFTYNYFNMFARIRKSTTRFLVPERFLKITDLLYTWYFPTRLLLEKIHSPRFRKIDYAEILREDIVKDKFEVCLDAILMYRLTGRIQDAGLNPELCIDWYENQAISKALSLGFRKHFPGVPLTGTQIFLHYPNFLSLSPSKSEIEASMVPDIILATSDFQCKMATMFAPELVCKPCGSLRYSHLFETNGNGILEQTVLPTKTIILLSSFDLDETMELLSQIQNIINDLDPDIEVFIKLHPDIRMETFMLQHKNSGWLKDIRIFQGNLMEAMNCATVVISKNSGSIVEAVARGIPTIFLGSQNKLNLNPLSGINIPFFTECYSCEELSLVLSQYLNFPAEKHRENRNSGIRLRDMFFTRVTEETLTPFLNIDHFQ